LAPSGNIGDNGSYFEPVHGSAPAMAGRGRANPMALLLTAAQLLRYLDMPAPAEQIRAAVRAVIRSGRTVTYDLGGTATTGQAAEAVAAAMARTSRDRQASVVAVGDELLSGTVTDTNGDEISALLGEHGYRVRARLIVGDTLTDITDAVRCRLGVDDVVAVIGGLGPTSDDRTRDAVAAACGLRLEHRETAWQAVRHRLESFNLTVHEANRRQALFPAGCGLLPNGNGTAWGARIELATTTVLMLPGPPRECLPMARSAIADLPRGQRSAVTTWRLLGVMESDVATDVDEVLRPVADQVGVSYLWRPPYVDVTVRALSESDSVPLPPSLERLLARHTVSRRGLDAFGELAAAPHFHLSAVDLGFAGEEFAAGLRRAGVAAIGEVGGPQGPALSLTGRAVFSGGGVGCFGSVRLTSEVAGGGRTRVFHLVVPNRGPEVAECAAAFFAWSVARTLAEATS
ncbi:MAG: hypothetical protein JO285_11595, partial [Kutzneria sp.]|nr:hypothetical protein [Kutzneria sp.]